MDNSVFVNKEIPDDIQVLKKDENEDERIIEFDRTNDDGSLKFLNIPRDVNDRSYNCMLTNQQRLSNKTFWLIDFMENVPTKNGARILVKIKDDPEDDDSRAQKFFTASPQIIYTLREIRKRRAFPRKVTLKSQGLHFWFE